MVSGKSQGDDYDIWKLRERDLLMDPAMTIILSIIGSVTASSGFWLLINKLTDRRSASTKLLLGMARDRIIFLGVKYIERESITKDEYDDYLEYFVEPYFEFGGNGLAEKIVNEVKQLPIYRRAPSTGELIITTEGE